jgi:hypothetical protein
MNLIQVAEKQPKWIVVAGGIVLVAVLGYVDYITGSEISFAIFYLLPVTAVAWHAGRSAGAFISFESSVAWFLAENAVGVTYSNPAIPYWNAIVRLGIFLIVTILLSTLKEMYVHLEERVDEKTAALSGEIEQRKFMEQVQSRLITELEAALANVKALSGLLPICAWCKKIRDDKGYWQQVEVYVTEHSEADFSHGICPECAAKQIDRVSKRARA